MRYYVTENGSGRLESDVADVLARMAAGERASILNVKNAVAENARLVELGNGGAIVIAADVN